MSLSNRTLALTDVSNTHAITDLSHGGQKSLSVEEARHPESIRSSVKTPRVELRVPFDQLGKPETQRTRFPRNL